ncbi:hypothetical protein K439DRAFT_1617353 [Ramaria rubella]|nr:hypothetical protein K439DRAFT_1617353 [Ramaria rubella]
MHSLALLFVVLAVLQVTFSAPLFHSHVSSRDVQAAIPHVPRSPSDPQTVIRLDGPEDEDQAEPPAHAPGVRFQPSTPHDAPTLPYSSKHFTFVVSPETPPHASSSRPQIQVAPGLTTQAPINQVTIPLEEGPPHPSTSLGRKRKAELRLSHATTPVNPASGSRIPAAHANDATSQQRATTQLYPSISGSQTPAPQAHHATILLEDPMEATTSSEPVKSTKKSKSQPTKKKPRPPKKSQPPPPPANAASQNQAAPAPFDYPTIQLDEVKGNPPVLVNPKRPSRAKHLTKP